MSSRSYEELKIGDTATFTKTISETDVYMFAGITGDLNPAHINEEWAKGTIFERRIVHGMLVCGLISTVLGTSLPGNGTIYVSQEFKFLAPVYLGDTVTAKVEVLEKLEKKRIVLRTVCVNQDGKEVVTGKAVVSPPRKPAVGTQSTHGTAHLQSTPA
jgi:3-hydroxybutyryl-CoA dehydratase